MPEQLHHRRLVVPAAGIVAFRSTPGGREVLLVYRPLLNDWVLPKGHIDAGELPPETACREFHEETGHKAVVVRPIAQVDYPVDDTIKRVYWFLGRLSDEEPDDVADPAEVSVVLWARLDKALHTLTYGDEREVLLWASQMEPTYPMLIVRHGKALARKSWKKADELRPLAARGRREAERLPHLLAAYGVADLASSPSDRCVETLDPYSEATGLDIMMLPVLSEEGAAADPPGVGAAMDELRDRLLAGGVPMAVCGHRPVLPAMVDALGTAYEGLRPGETMVVHLDPESGAVVATERYASKTR